MKVLKRNWNASIHGDAPRESNSFNYHGFVMESESVFKINACLNTASRGEINV